MCLQCYISYYHPSTGAPLYLPQMIELILSLHIISTMSQTHTLLPLDRIADPPSPFLPIYHPSVALQPPSPTAWLLRKVSSQPEGPSSPFIITLCRKHAPLFFSVVVWSNEFILHRIWIPTGTQVICAPTLHVNAHCILSRP